MKRSVIMFMLSLPKHYGVHVEPLVAFVTDFSPCRQVNLTEE
jgi:hypothetical protein